MACHQSARHGQLPRHEAVVFVVISATLAGDAASGMERHRHLDTRANARARWCQPLVVFMACSFVRRGYEGLRCGYTTASTPAAAAAAVEDAERTTEKPADGQ